jgi:hypothetical protein
MDTSSQILSLPIGKPVPCFNLPDISGVAHSLDEFLGRILLLNFWSAECPWSERADRVLVHLLAGWGSQVNLLTIASNANEPLDLIRQVAGERGLPLVLHDASHVIADLYGAQTTPHLYMIDADGILRYQGAFDDVTFRQRTPVRFYLKDAVDALLEGKLPDPAQTQAYGCAIVRFSL